MIKYLFSTILLFMSNVIYAGDSIVPCSIIRYIKYPIYKDPAKEAKAKYAYCLLQTCDLKNPEASRPMIEVEFLGMKKMVTFDTVKKFNSAQEAIQYSYEHAIWDIQLQEDVFKEDKVLNELYQKMQPYLNKGWKIKFEGLRMQLYKTDSIWVLLDNKINAPQDIYNTAEKRAKEYGKKCIPEIILNIYPARHSIDMLSPNSAITYEKAKGIETPNYQIFPYTVVGLDNQMYSVYPKKISEEVYSVLHALELLK